MTTMFSIKCFLLLFGSQICMASVDLEISVLQYNNPTGTSYHGMNYTGDRKCCDTGGDNNCGHVFDTCDVFFAICVGILEPAFVPNGCNGSYTDTKEDVSPDTNLINVTQRKNIMRMSTMAWWHEDKVNLTANVFDVDEVNKSTGAMDTELVDFFSQPLNITPDSNFLASKSHILLLMNKVRVWCSPGWYGANCEKQCNGATSKGFYDCTTNGTLIPADICSSKDLLVMSLKTGILDILPLFSLQYKLIEFIATNVCPRSSTKTSVHLNNIHYKRSSPSDSTVDVEFYALCNNTSVSRLKLTETVFMLNQFALYPEFPANLFSVPVLSPKVSEVGFQTNRTTIYFLVRIVNFENMGSHQCRLGNVGQACNPVISICFRKWKFLLANNADPDQMPHYVASDLGLHCLLITLLPVSRSLCNSVKVNNANTLTDCNGDLVDAANTRQTSDSAPNSTVLFSLAAYPGSAVITVYDEMIGTAEVASFNISLANLTVDTYFTGSFPHTFTVAANNVKLVLEIMSWCGKFSYGPQCASTKPALRVGSFRPACSSLIPCQHNGFCRGGVCICASGWTGPTCSIDIDECALGACVHSFGCVNTEGSYICNCTSGFTGQTCDKDVDECDKSPCHNGSTCLNTYGSYKCLCTTYWKGANCNESDFCGQNICDHYTICSESNGDFRCGCSPGWTSKRCDQDVNECLHNACNNTAASECVNNIGSYTCRCKPGFEGPSCQAINFCKNLRPCQNQGRCYNVGGRYFCNCPVAWRGRNCTEPVDSCDDNPCHNNGTCFETRGGGFQCSCAQGWTGQFCTENIDECTSFDGSKLCTNHGHCRDTPGNFTCACNSGWTGTFCETDMLECAAAPCLNNGTCTNLPGGYTCSCASGWGGSNCQDDIDECITLSPCKNSGTCINLNGSYECVCIQAWDGENCTLDIDECQTQKNLCSHGGTCHNSNGGFNCSCLTGWKGNLCTEDVDECQLYHPCLNSGTCVNTNGAYNCTCPSSWTGVNCTDNVNECDVYLGICAHGTCADINGGYNCSCFLGWQGQNCIDDIDECTNIDICSNYSICVNTLGDYHCNCVDGWTGRKCDTNIDECSSNPCQNGGTCIDKTAYYKCICPNGWDDLNCQTDIDECIHAPCPSGQMCHNLNGSYACEILATTTVRKGQTSTSSSTSNPTTFIAVRSTSIVTSSSTSADTVSTSSVPTSVDVFTLQFVSPVAQSNLPTVRNGIHDILKLLNCHDSSRIYVSLVQNSISNPKTVEFHAQCDGHHLTNKEINSAIRTLSKEKLATYFPVALEQTSKPPEKESWISGHIPVVGGAAAGGLLVIIIVITAYVVYRNRQNKKYRKGPQNIEHEDTFMPDTFMDTEGKECVMIANPTYDSLYQKQTQA